MFETRRMKADDKNGIPGRHQSTTFSLLFSPSATEKSRTDNVKRTEGMRTSSSSSTLQLVMRRKREGENTRDRTEQAPNEGSLSH